MQQCRVPGYPGSSEGHSCAPTWHANLQSTINPKSPKNVLSVELYAPQSQSHSESHASCTQCQCKTESGIQISPNPRACRCHGRRHGRRCDHRRRDRRRRSRAAASRRTCGSCSATQNCGSRSSGTPSPRVGGRGRLCGAVRAVVVPYAGTAVRVRVLAPGIGKATTSSRSRPLLSLGP